MDLSFSFENARYAFGKADRVTVEGIPYRVHVETEVGVVFTRDDTTALSAQFSHADLARLGSLGRIRVERDYFDREAARKRQLKSHVSTSALIGRPMRRLTKKDAYCQAALELHHEKLMGFTDTSIAANTQLLVGRVFLRGALSKNVTREGRPGARKAFGMLYSWLSASRLSKDPGPIRVILRDVIAQNVPLVTGRKLLGEPVVRPRLSSVRSIARTEGIHPKTLRNVLRAAGLLPHQDEGDAVERIIVDYDRARGLIDAAKHAVPASQVPDILNASRPLVAALIELEILTRIHDHDGLKSKVGKAIDGRSIQKVQTFLKDKIPSVAEAPEGLACLSNSAERARARLKVILELLFAGHLHRVVRLAGQTGFGAILVDPEEIKRVLESPPPGLSEEVYYAFA
ncbi:hypothetical protein OEZ60_13245 [Defluviimonas sp. WL0024]|uniref:Uncharacterized protein n=1 Tax=Albidovulum salinarum TaxID=2984153 RepID=A0ABT2X4V8_9RHOB|nr:hypothetical protein [Defluviimonas sp. WL0024]MCU9848969.1 hypothetical protein [Defluviimonas sp. WL0024]